MLPEMDEPTRRTLAEIDVEHRNVVLDAIIDNQQVPAEVLKDYPDLDTPTQFAARREPDETTDRKPELTVSDVEKEIESEPGTVLDAEISDDAFQDVDDTDVQFAAR